MCTHHRPLLAYMSGNRAIISVTFILERKYALTYNTAKNDLKVNPEEVQQKLIKKKTAATL